MKKTAAITFFMLIFYSAISAQEYTSYIIGDSEDVTPQVTFGICLMGGASEQDDAMIRFLEASGGGDIVVIRISGSDLYNEYMYSDLGVTVNSVETLLIPTVNAANDPYVETQVRNAEAVWIAGGDQADYRQYWMGTTLEDAINDHVNIKQGPIGGISAGMAIMAGYSFTAENGTVYSDEALADPYNTYMTFGDNDFLQVPGMENIITDTHYNDPDRKGRHFAFMARYVADKNERPYGIACNEYVAVYIDESNIASVYGNPSYDDYAYFLQTNEGNPYEPETCQPGTPLSWDRNHQAVKTYKILGTADGSRTFDLNDWQTGNGGVWEYWYAVNGEFFSSTSSVSQTSSDELKIFPNPVKMMLILDTNDPSNKIIKIFDMNGRLMVFEDTCGTGVSFDVSGFPEGVYSIEIISENYKKTAGFIKN